MPSKLFLMIISLVLGMPALSSSVVARNNQGPDTTEPIREIENIFGIRVEAKVSEFSVATRHGRIEGTAADDAALNKYIPLFSQEFKLYPVEFVNRTQLERIVICDQLRFAGQRRNAVPDFEHNTLYLDAHRGNHNRRYQQAVIHHEFFHIVDYRDDGFVYRDPEWAALNVAEFRYGPGGRTVQETPSTAKLTDQRKGFLNHYSTLGVEEDKAELFAHLIVNAHYLEQRLLTDRVLQAKVDLLKKQLKNFCPEINRGYWMTISQVDRVSLDPPSQPTQPVDEPTHTPSLDELLLFFPSKFPVGEWEPQQVEFEDVWFAAQDGTRLHGWYCPCKNPRAIVLYAHGNAGNLSNRVPIMTALHELQITAMFFDYRGYGRSEGSPTTTGVISDTKAAVKYLAQRVKVEPSDLILMGRSLGGAIVIEIAPDFQPKGIIVESSFSSLKQVAALHYPRLAWLVPRKKLDSKSRIKQYTGSLLQSHGTHDQTVPLVLGQELFQAANEPKTFLKVPYANHNDPLPQAYYDQVGRFIDSLERPNHNK